MPTPKFLLDDGSRPINGNLTVTGDIDCDEVACDDLRVNDVRGNGSDPIEFNEDVRFNDSVDIDALLDMNNHRIDGVANPTSSDDAATKDYVDDEINDALSDARLKKNITTIPHALERVLKLRGVRFEWDVPSGRHVGPDHGFIAQEVENVIPEAVSERVEKWRCATCAEYNDPCDACYSQWGPYKRLDDSQIIPLLVEAIKELKKEIETLKARP